MNARQQTQRLGKQSSVAQKVYECVSWDTPHDLHDIYAQMKAQYGTGVGINVVRACLGALQDDDLIKSVGHGEYIRVIVRENKEPVMKPTLASVEVKPLKNKEKGAPSVAAASLPEAKPTHQIHATPLGLLAEISADMYTFAAEAQKTLASLAERIGDAALIIEQDREANEAYVAKMKQLRDLMKSLGE